MNQEVYEFLTRPRRIGKKIMRLEARRNELITCMLPSGIRYDLEKVQTSPDDPMIRLAGEIDEIDRKIAQLKQEKIKATRQISDTIETLPDEDEKTVLMLHWVHREKMQDVAEKLYCSRRTVFRIYQRGINDLEEKLAHLAL